MLGLPLVGGVLGFLAGWWMPVVVLEAATIAALAGTAVTNYAVEGKQKRYIKGAFSQYLSPSVIEQLIAHPERLKLGGERRVLSIFFSDLEGFTGISEGLGPEELTRLLNQYLTAMTEIIQDEGGTVDKYEGDAIIAFWNAPLDVEDHAVRAVRAALRCQRKLAELRPAFRKEFGKDLYVRIGVNTGPAVVGNMGSHTRFDYTMLGDSVNLAARLEGVNKQFGTYTMISKATLEACHGEFPARELSRVAVVGRNEPVTVFEPMWEDEHKERAEVLERFGHGLNAYYEGHFDGALEQFSAIADRDAPASRYVERCRRLKEDCPLEWEGVWVMTSK
jgi:adenylate cyclase